MFDVSFKNQEDRQSAANVILQRSLFFLLWIRSPFAPMQSKWEQKKKQLRTGLVIYLRMIYGVRA